MAEVSDNSTKTSSNTSLNSLADRVRGVEARVFHVIDASDVELRPAEIARKIHYPRKPTRGQYTTVRVVCRKLLEKGLVLQPYLGAYCNKITHTVRFVPLCVHNVTLLARVCQSVVHWENDEFVGGVKIHVCFGRERKQVSGYIACDVGGMSRDACLLALNRWFDVVEGRLGYCLQDLVLQTVEFNKDYHGVRIDGFQCVTKKDLYGIIDRTYQKEENVIRRERKVTQSMSINKFEAEIHRGIEEIGRSQERFELQQEVKQNTEALKFTNSRILQVERLTEAVYQALGKMPKVQNFEVAVEKVAFNVNKLNEILSRLVDVEDPKRLAVGQKKIGEYSV